MKISAGIIFLFDNKVLLCHPTNASYNNSFSFPKGQVDEGETFEETAIRECKEEIGINLYNPKFASKYEVEYYNKNKKKIVKKVILFLLKIHSLSEIGLTNLVVPKTQLQLDEIDWAGFLTKQESELKIFWRFHEILNQVLK